MNMFVLLALACAVVIAAAQNACASTSCPVGSACKELGNNRARCVAPPRKANDSKCKNPREEWKECASCEATCTNKQPFCTMMCQPALCQCRQGYFRTKKGECITENECDIAAQAGSPRVRRSHASAKSQRDCGPNSTFRNCSSHCPPKCGEYILKKACPATCGPPRCECKPGFYSNKVGDCVNKSDCDVEASLPEITCANIDCVSGFRCRMTNGAPKCFPGKSVTCAGFQCDVGHHCRIIQQTPRCVRKTRSITCANVRCAGPCTDTPTGPRCGARPKPLVLPISAGPSSSQRPLILPISAGPTSN